MTNNCIFCSIARKEKEVPFFQIYETNNFIAFLDIYPLSEGHRICIPKSHYPDVWSVPNIDEFMRFCKTVANKFQSVTGNRTVHSYILGTTVPHAAIHIVPNINIFNQYSFAYAQHKLIEQFKRKSIMDIGAQIRDRYKVA